METGQAFRVHVTERLQAIADTYFKRSIGATVTLGQAPYDSFQCDIVMHVMQGLVLKGSNRAAVANVAFIVLAFLYTHYRDTDTGTLRCSEKSAEKRSSRFNGWNVKIHVPDRMCLLILNITLRLMFTLFK